MRSDPPSAMIKFPTFQRHEGTPIARRAVLYLVLLFVIRLLVLAEQLLGALDQRECGSVPGDHFVLAVQDHHLNLYLVPGQAAVW